MHKPALIAGALYCALTGSVVAGERGIASWYGPGFHGNRTACGQLYNQWGITAAHRSLPCGSKAKVVNLANNLSVIVTITDRGPFVRKRIIDLSRGAKNAIGMGSLANVLVLPLR